MEQFNDWDLQAVVRSCGSSAHAEEPRDGARRAEAREAEAGAPEPAPAPRDRPPVRAAPVAAARELTRASAPKDAALLYDLECLDLDRKPFVLAPTAGEDGREVMISFPAAANSTSGVQQRAVPPGREPGARTSRPKRSKKSQLKKVVREMPVADGGVSSSDPWAWRKYGQKPIKGSPYPRGYYKCSSRKGCMARKLVERSQAKPGVLIVTYMAEHCHPVPTQLNALAGTTRHTKSSSAAATEDHPASSPRSQDQAHVADRANGADTNEASTAPVAVECGALEASAAADDENEFWPERMVLDELLAPVDDDFDFEQHLLEEDGVLVRRLSL